MIRKTMEYSSLYEILKLIFFSLLKKDKAKEKINFNNGDRYEGKQNNEKTNVNGTYTWKNGDKYVGEFKNKMFEGYGIKYYSNGDKYEGQWKNNLRNGNGTITFQNG